LSEKETDAAPRVPNDQGIDPWRTRLMNVWSGLLALVGVAFVGQGGLTGQQVVTAPARLSVYATAVLCFVVAAIGRGLSLRTRALLLIAGLVFAPVIGFPSLGVMGPGEVLIYLSCLFTAVLFLGLRGTLIAWGAITTLWIVTLVLIGTGVIVVEPAYSVFDLRILAVGLRQGILVGGFGGALALGTALVLARLQDSLQETRVAESALRASEARWRSLVDNTPLGVVILDPECRVEFLNHDLLGYRREKAAGEDFLRFASTLDEGNRWRATVEAVLRSGQTGLLETRAKARDGSLARLEMGFSPIMKDGVVHRVTVIIADVTEKHLLTEQVRQSQKMQAVGELTGGLAHDFNNLLTVIQGNLEFISLESEDPTTREFTDLALDAVRRGSSLTHRLLAFSRRQALEPMAVDTAEILRGLQVLLARMMGETVEVRFDVEAGIWPCEVDAAQLEHALLNIAINARDAMDGKGRITLTCENRTVLPRRRRKVDELEPGEYVAFVVRDEGAGIPPEVLGRIFDPFFTTKGVGKGTGLGLSMVYGFAKQSGGSIVVESEVGVGTTMRLLIPRAHTTPAKPLTAATPDRGDRQLVLVLEDDEALRKVVVRTLESLGYRTAVAGTAAEAHRVIDGLTDGPPNLVLTDIVLPGGVSGAEFAAELREKNPNLPLLLMSGYSEDFREEISGLGEGVELLAKPFGREVLSKAVARALDRTAPVQARPGAQ